LSIEDVIIFHGALYMLSFLKHWVLSFYKVSKCYHFRVLSFMLSFGVIIYLMLSFHVIIFLCYHLMLSFAVIIWCYNLVLSFFYVII
jgi:hypothetical protein